MTQTNLAELVSWDRYREARTDVFPSTGSLEWFVRRHKPALVARGALLLHAKRWLVHASRMDAYVLENSAAAAQRQVERLQA